MNEYATEAETDALIVSDTRSENQKKLDRLLDELGAWEMEAEPFKILYKITLDLMENTGNKL